MKKITILFTVLVALISACNSTKNSANITTLGPVVFNEQISSGNATLVDVRTPSEFAEGKIPGAVNINLHDNNFETQITALPKDKPVYIYCLSGGRTKEAADIFAKNGYTVNVLEGGILKWNAMQMPLERPQVETSSEPTVSFQEAIAGDKLVMVDFYADWCRPCKIMEPFVERIKGERKDEVTIIKIDVESEKALSEQYSITALPTLMMFKNGKALYTQPGLHTYEQLNELVNQYK